MKIMLTTNGTSHNGSCTGKTGATAPTQDLVHNKTQTQPINPVVQVGGYRRSNELEDSITEENNTTDYNHYNQSEGSYSFQELQLPSSI